MPNYAAKRKQYEGYAHDLDFPNVGANMIRSSRVQTFSFNSPFTSGTSPYSSAQMCFAVKSAGIIPQTLTPAYTSFCKSNASAINGNWFDMGAENSADTMVATTINSTPRQAFPDVFCSINPSSYAGSQARYDS